MTCMSRVDAIGRLHQIEAAEARPCRRNSGTMRTRSRAPCLRAQQIALPEAPAAPAAIMALGIDAAASPSRSTSVQMSVARIGREDRDGARELGQHHGERVRLRADRAGGAPDLERVERDTVRAAPAAPAPPVRTRKWKCSGSRKKSVLLVVTASIRWTDFVVQPALVEHDSGSSPPAMPMPVARSAAAQPALHHGLLGWRHLDAAVIRG